MTIETMAREFRYDGVRLPDPNPKLTVEEVRTAFSATYPEIATAAEGRTRKTSEIVREFKKCPQFQQSCQILARALQHNAYGRRGSAMKAPAGLVPLG